LIKYRTRRRWREWRCSSTYLLSSALDGGEGGRNRQQPWNEKVRGEREVKDMKERRKRWKWRRKCSKKNGQENRKSRMGKIKTERGMVEEE
jgi:hypothetical protein